MTGNTSQPGTLVLSGILDTFSHIFWRKPVFSVSGTAEPVQFSLVLHEMQNIKRSKRFPIDIYLSSKKFAVQPQVILQAQLSILFSRTHLEDHS